ncbi:hypothetical protein [Burkholderia guangdongensis]|uniref:hypothetical protein n=1 Tax=Burkholderia guangdongensis TaxID=1792500 RepID=UPI0015CCEFC5|nr:hypothetical protein [Burkholderia guangdongensis]
MINPRASFNVLPSFTASDRRNRGFVFAVFVIVTLLHVFALIALRESPQVKATAARPKAAPLIIRMIPPETQPTSAAPAEERVTSIRARPKQQAPKPRSSRTGTESAKPIPKARATSATAARPSPAANPEPTRNANAQSNEAPTPSVDWQNDLKRLPPSRTNRYRPASPFAPSNAETPSEAPESPLARGIDKSQRRDCRTAHARHGLLAIPMLMYGATSDSGCKW